MGRILKELFHKFILKRLKAFNAYCDETSKEKTTGTVKRKYKLALNVIRDIQIYPFFILNSKRNFSEMYAFEIKRGDWAARKFSITNVPFLHRSSSYIDIRKVELPAQDELYQKIKQYFKFFWVGKLKKTKFEELQEFIKKVKLTTDVKPEDKGLLLKELTGDDGGYNVDSLINKYQI